MNENERRPRKSRSGRLSILKALPVDGNSDDELTMRRKSNRNKKRVSFSEYKSVKEFKKEGANPDHPIFECENVDDNENVANCILDELEKTTLQHDSMNMTAVNGLPVEDGTCLDITSNILNLMKETNDNTDSTPTNPVGSFVSPCRPHFSRRSGEKNTTSNILESLNATAANDIMDEAVTLKMDSSLSSNVDKLTEDEMQQQQKENTAVMNDEEMEGDMEGPKSSDFLAYFRQRFSAEELTPRNEETEQSTTLPGSYANIELDVNALKKTETSDFLSNFKSGSIAPRPVEGNGKDLHVKTNLVESDCVYEKVDNVAGISSASLYLASDDVKERFSASALKSSTSQLLGNADGVGGVGDGGPFVVKVQSDQHSSTNSAATFNKMNSGGNFRSGALPPAFSCTPNFRSRQTNDESVLATPLDTPDSSDMIVDLTNVTQNVSLLGNCSLLSKLEELNTTDCKSPKIDNAQAIATPRIAEVCGELGNTLSGIDCNQPVIESTQSGIDFNLPSVDSSLPSALNHDNMDQISITLQSEVKRTHHTLSGIDSNEHDTESNLSSADCNHPSASNHEDMDQMSITLLSQDENSHHTLPFPNAIESGFNSNSHGINSNPTDIVDANNFNELCHKSSGQPPKSVSVGTTPDAISATVNAVNIEGIAFLKPVQSRVLGDVGSFTVNTCTQQQDVESVNCMISSSVEPLKDEVEPSLVIASDVKLVRDRGEDTTDQSCRKSIVEQNVDEETTQNMTDIINMHRKSLASSSNRQLIIQGQQQTQTSAFKPFGASLSTSRLVPATVIPQQSVAETTKLLIENKSQDCISKLDSVSFEQTSDAIAKLDSNPRVRDSGELKQTGDPPTSTAPHSDVSTIHPGSSLEGVAEKQVTDERSSQKDRRRTFTISKQPVSASTDGAEIAVVDINKQPDISSHQLESCTVSTAKEKRDRRKTYTIRPIGHETIISGDADEGNWLEDSGLELTNMFKHPIANSSVMDAQLYDNNSRLLTEERKDIELTSQKVTKNKPETLSTRCKDTELMTPKAKKSKKSSAGEDTELMTANVTKSKLETLLTPSRDTALVTPKAKRSKIETQLSPVKETAFKKSKIETLLSPGKNSELTRVGTLSKSSSFLGETKTNVNEEENASMSSGTNLKEDSTVEKEACDVTYVTVSKEKDTSYDIDKEHVGDDVSIDNAECDIATVDVEDDIDRKGCNDSTKNAKKETTFFTQQKIVSPSSTQPSKETMGSKHRSQKKIKNKRQLANTNLKVESKAFDIEMTREIVDPFASRPKIPRGDEHDDVTMTSLSRCSPEKCQPLTPKRRSSRLNQREDLSSTNTLQDGSPLNDFTPIRRNTTRNTSSFTKNTYENTPTNQRPSESINNATPVGRRSIRKTPSKQATSNRSRNATATLDAKDFSMTTATTMTTSSAKKRQMFVDVAKNIEESLPSSKGQSNRIRRSEKVLRMTGLHGVNDDRWTLVKVTKSNDGVYIMHISFTLYIYHHIKITIDDKRILDIKVECQLNEKLCTGEQWYINTMERILTRDYLLEEFSQVTAIPGLIDKFADIVDNWYPKIYDFYRTFNEYLGELHLFDDRVQFQFLSRYDRQCSEFFLNVHFNVAEEQPRFECSLQHSLFYFMLDEVMKVVESNQASKRDDDRSPFKTLCTKIREFSKNIQLHHSELKLKKDSNKTSYPVKIF